MPVLIARSPLGFKRGLLLVLLVLGGAFAAPIGAANAAFKASDQLTVSKVGGTRQLVTADQRTTLLRGVNVNSLIKYDEGRDPYPASVADANEIKALGVNFVRLGVSWSEIMPKRGKLNRSYLNKVRKTAKIFTDREIYVLLDMHQDRYARGLGQKNAEADGAPRWAAITDGFPCTGNSANAYYLTPCARQAADNFWKNRKVGGKGLHQYYIAAMASLLKVGKSLGAGMAGLELYNEPAPADSSSNGSFEKKLLWPFYRKIISSLRKRGYSKPIWFEPNVTRTNSDKDTHAARFSSDRNLVYAPHVYSDIYNAGGISQNTVGKLQRSFDDVRIEANKYRAATVIGELAGVTGTFGAQWESYRQVSLNLLDERMLGGAWWVWKQNRNSNYDWSILRADGGLREGTVIAEDIGRPRPLSGVGLASFSYNGPSCQGALCVNVNGKGGYVYLWSGASRSANGVLGNAVTIDGAAATGATRVSITTKTRKAVRVRGKNRYKIKTTTRTKTENAEVVKISPFRGSFAGVELGGSVIRVAVPAGVHSIQLR